MIYIHTALAFTATLIITPLIRHITIKNGWMAHPSQNRWHKKPTALFGGIAIYIGIALPLLSVADFHQLTFHLKDQPESMRAASFGAVVWIGMSLLFILGLIDDIIRIKPHTKLVGQILVASLVTFLGFRLHWVVSLTLDTMITLVWIVGITNAFNLLDNMDGLCTGVGMICALFLAVLFTGIAPQAALTAMILAASLAAFLLYNFNPASIFMGDCGSLIIGFILAMLTLHYPEASGFNSVSTYAVPIMILMAPISDTVLVTLVRLLSGRKASVGGKDHTSHRLVLMGFSEKNAVLFIYGIGLISGLSALFISQSDTLTSPAVIIPMVLAIILMGVYLAQLRVYPEKEFSLLRDRSYTPVLVELTYKRQMMLVILDLCLIAFSYYLAYRLRFGAYEFAIYFNVFLRSLPAVIACKFVVFFATGVYRGIWGYMSTNDVFVYLKSSFLATILTIATVTFIYRFKDFSKGIFFIDLFLTTGFLLGTRGSFRIFLDSMKRKKLAGQTVLIYGAGRGGEILLREIINNPKIRIKPTGFIDDDILKAGKKLQGYSIIGDFNHFQDNFAKFKVNGLLISFEERESSQIETAKQFCKANNMFLKHFSIHLDDVDLEVRNA
ncbi:glycosyl transferase [Desulfococcaceae bacterium HSG9]|nr:glycosyl transferase [Desulfococcaceae bacterium HSG9]